MRGIIVLMILIMPLVANAQGFKRKKQKVSHAQGTLWGYWGYNRSAYSRSNIRFVGPGYDFTMTGARAHDNPSKGIEQYVNPLKITVPQYNARIGYYIKHHWSISFGVDHMKYIFQDRNEVSLSGTIDPGVDNTTNLSGTYNSEAITTDRSTFHYENSNGVNYLSFQLTRTDLLFAFGKKQQIGISSNLGVGTGPLLSYNDFLFGGRETKETSSMSGYGLSGHVGLRFEFFKHLFFQTTLSGGYHHQLKVRTRTSDASSYARHAYGFIGFDAGIGFLLYVRPTNSCDSCPVW